MHGRANRIKSGDKSEVAMPKLVVGGLVPIKLHLRSASAIAFTGTLLGNTLEKDAPRSETQGGSW